MPEPRTFTEADYAARELAELRELADDRGYAVGQIADGAELAAGALVLVVTPRSPDLLTVGTISAADLIGGRGRVVLVDRATSEVCGVMPVSDAYAYIAEHSD